MKPWMWGALGLSALFVLMSKKGPIYVSRTGISGVVTPDFAADNAISTTVKGNTPDVGTLTAADIFPESSGWKL